MASDSTPELGCNFYSRSRFRYSVPCQHAHQCYMTSHPDPIPVSSKDHLINTYELGSCEKNERTAAERFKPEHSRDSSSIGSSGKPNGAQLSGWKPSFVRAGPLVGLAALLLAFLQVYASYVVLNQSDGRPVASWKFKPSVYIAILTACSNGAISFAVAQGAVITFWLRCLRGTTLAQLHRDWAASSQVYNALRCGKHVSLLAIACIFATLVVIDGPLLQRASFTKSTNSNDPVNLAVSVVPEIPSYFTGSYDAGGSQAKFSNAMLSVMNEFSSGTPITSAIQGCVDNCIATIRAPALVSHNCNWNVTWKNFSAPYTKAENKVYYSTGGFPTSRELFETKLTPIYGATETLDLHVLLTGDQVAKTCAGPVNSTHCYLRSAIAEYEVRVTNGAVTLIDPANPTFIAWANNTAITNATIDRYHLRENNGSAWINTTLSGLVNAFSFAFEFYGYADQPKAKSGTFNIYNSETWFEYQHTTNYQQYNNHKACTYTWRDPRPAVMAGLNELMFRTGVHVANNYDLASLKHRLDPSVQMKYNVTGKLQSPVEVFKSDFPFFVAAAAIQQLTIVLVLSTFWGYWRLGRHVSFSPLETAKAFGAVLLAEVPSNLSGMKIAALKDDKYVRYGLVESDSKPVDSKVCRKAGTLKISHRELVHAPEEGNLCMC